MFAIKDYIFAAILLALVTYSTSLYLSNRNYEIDNKNANDAIQAYEALIKTIPFNTEVKEQKEVANEKTTNILSNVNVIPDGKHRL